MAFSIAPGLTLPSKPEVPQSIAQKPLAKLSKPLAPAAPKTTGTNLDAIIKGIQKDKGFQVINRGSDIPRIKRIPTGMFEFDDATGGGFPCGRYSVVYGPESSGKTNITYCAIAQAQRLPAPCNKAILVDLEGTFDPLWAMQFGIDVDALMVVRPGYGEEAVDVIDALVRADDVAILVMDSIATVVSSKEVAQSTEKFDVGTSAILMKRLVNKLVIALASEAKNEHFPCVILINQIRYKIGVMFGDPETTPGGKAVLFLSSLTVRVSGKNVMVASVDPSIPTFKHIDATIKKAKLPVSRSVFEFDMCVLAHSTLSVGETDSWSMVEGQLKFLGELKKVEKGQGWTLFGMTFATLVPIKDTYQGDDDFRLKCQQTITQASSGKMFLIQPVSLVTTGAPEIVYVPGEDNGA